jgi:hypothetical protein
LLVDRDVVLIRDRCSLLSLRERFLLTRRFIPSGDGPSADSIAAEGPLR